MAFIYTLDGQRYEDDFHFWYVNGCRPDQEFKIPVEGGRVIEAIGGGREGVADSGMVHTRRGPDGPGRLGRKPGWCK